ncbi:hypothetical protein [Pseudosulfitobacter sp. DSM 107133]|uniref:hypothetical protein n=1 Tax=Pseudosulfitobacter sp. DSM 107133 TaxID=2883100 RepID=UPI001FAD1B63|nr:hypothetical protein [Pseudosulfitobacter sp. DSM 107133]
MPIFLTLLDDPVRQDQPGPSFGSDAATGRPLLATASSVLPPLARLTLPQYISETAHVALMAKVLTLFILPNRMNHNQASLGIPSDSGFVRNALNAGPKAINWNGAAF